MWCLVIFDFLPSEAERLCFVVSVVEASVGWWFGLETRANSETSACLSVCRFVERVISQESVDWSRRASRAAEVSSKCDLC